MLKKQNGITLVALVITIIVLLILAGVSISLVVGQGGILGKATNAVDANEVATVKQEIQLAVADAQMAYYTDWTSNQGVKKSTYFGKDAFYQNNCTSAKAGTVSVTSKPNPDADTGNVVVTYTTKSNVVYTATFDVSNPTSITYKDSADKEV